MERIKLHLLRIEENINFLTSLNTNIKTNKQMKNNELEILLQEQSKINETMLVMLKDALSDIKQLKEDVQQLEEHMMIQQNKGRRFGGSFGGVLSNK